MEVHLDTPTSAVLRSMEPQLRDEKPLLYLVLRPQAMIDAGDPPALLHRFLADLGYVPELLDESGDGTERWMFQHPDGTRP